MQGLGVYDPVPLRWLHLTMQGIGFTDEVPRAQVHDIDCSKLHTHRARRAHLSRQFRALIRRLWGLAYVAGRDRVVWHSTARSSGSRARPETTHRRRPSVTVVCEGRRVGSPQDLPMRVGHHRRGVRQPRQRRSRLTVRQADRVGGSRVTRATLWSSPYWAGVARAPAREPARAESRR